MVKSCGGAVFDAEVIDYKGKLDAVGCMGEKTWDIWMLEVALSGEVLDKMLVGEVRGLGETVHAFVDLEQDGVVTEESMKIVLGENVFGYEFAGYGDKFRAFEVGAEEEVNDIEVGKSGISAVVAAIGDD